MTDTLIDAPFRPPDSPPPPNGGGPEAPPRGPLITADLLNGLGRNPRAFDRHQDISDALLDSTIPTDMAGLENGVDALITDITQNPELDTDTKKAAAEFQERYKKKEVDFDSILKGVDQSELSIEDKTAMKELATKMQQDMIAAGPDATSEEKASIIKRVAGNMGGSLKMIGMGVGVIGLLVGVAIFRAAKSVGGGQQG